jgi:hypothetical protein
MLLVKPGSARKRIQVTVADLRSQNINKISLQSNHTTLRGRRVSTSIITNNVETRNASMNQVLSAEDILLAAESRNVQATISAIAKHLAELNSSLVFLASRRVPTVEGQLRLITLVALDYHAILYLSQ